MADAVPGQVPSLDQRKRPKSSAAGDAREQGMFHASIHFGTVRGIELGANWSWLLVFGLIVWSLATYAFPVAVEGRTTAEYIAMALIGAALFFTSLMLHELGHAVIAQREGMEIAGITLWVFGGVAKFRGMFPSASAEFRVAIAGPLVSVALGVIFVSLGAIPGLPDTVAAVATWLGEINIVLVLFNMLPALPLDGGRVLRSAIWYFSGDFTRATRAAGALARFIGRLMIFGGVFSMLLVGYAGGLWLALIGWFVTIAAAAEIQLATMRGAFEGLVVRDAMVGRPATAPAELTLSAFVDEIFPHARHVAYPVTEDQRIVGLLAFKDLLGVPRDQWQVLTVRSMMTETASAPTLDEDAELADAALELAQSRLGRALVLDHGRPVGMISSTDVSRLLELRANQSKAAAAIRRT